MCIVTRNPCPQCTMRPHHMAGVNVPSGDRSMSYLVCWDCGMIRAIIATGQWARSREIRPSKRGRKGRQERGALLV